MIEANLPVAIIGGGPVGLAAMAHLIERGETPILFEAGTSIGASVAAWGHVRMFSPWEFNVDAASVRLLEAHGWEMPPLAELPTGQDLLEEYLIPFAELPEITPHIHVGSKVVAISRRYIDKMKNANRDKAPFVLHICHSDGRETIVEAKAVIDASGTWTQPNPIGSGGLPAIGEKRFADRIAYGIPDVLGADRETYMDQRVAVIGNGHSAINGLLDLAELQEDSPNMHIYWVMRTTNMQRVYGGGEDDALEARGKLGTRIKALVEAGKVTIVAPFCTRSVEQAENGIALSGDTPDGIETIYVDRIVASTGARPNLDMLRELRLELDPAVESTPELAPLIDPNLHSCGTVRPHGEAELRHPEKDFYIVGMKSYGRAPTFLLATGYEQVRSVVAGLVGDWDAARDVQLNLPETGVCSSDFDDELEGGACCSPTQTEVSTSVISLGNIPIGDGLISLNVGGSNNSCGDGC